MKIKDVTEGLLDQLNAARFGGKLAGLRGAKNLFRNQRIMDADSVFTDALSQWRELAKKLQAASYEMSDPDVYQEQLNIWLGKWLASDKNAPEYEGPKLPNMHPLTIKQYIYNAIVDKQSGNLQQASSDASIVSDDPVILGYKGQNYSLDSNTGKWQNDQGQYPIQASQLFLHKQADLLFHASPEWRSAYEKFQNSGQTPSGATATPGGATTGASKMAPGVTVVNTEPLILQVRKQNYYIGNTGKWHKWGSSKPVDETIGAFLDQQAKIAKAGQVL